MRKNPMILKRNLAGNMSNSAFRDSKDNIILWTNS